MKKNRKNTLKGLAVGAPLLLLGAPALAANLPNLSSRTRSSNLRPKQSFIQQGELNRKKRSSGAFSAFGGQKTTARKQSQRAENSEVLKFLNENNLLASSMTRASSLSGDLQGRKVFSHTTSVGHCSYTFSTYSSPASQTEYACAAAGSGYVWHPAAVADTTPATLSTPSSSNITASTADLSATSNEDGTIYYVVTTSPSSPSSNDVLAGNDETGTAAFKSGNSAVSADIAQTFSVSGLADNTTYYFYVTAVDGADNISGISSASFTTSAAADATPPTLSAVGSSSVTGSSADLSATSNESGTLYYVMTTSASAPTNTQVVAGQDNLGAAAFKSANAAVTADTAKTLSVSGLTDSTTYYFYIVAKDATGNNSLVSSSSFTTPDVTAPLLLTVSAGNITASAVDLSATSNEDGTMYYMVTDAASTPTAANVKSGSAGSGITLIASGSSAVSANTAKIFSVSSLTSATTYYFYFVAEDATSNTSTVSWTSFTTANTTPTIAIDNADLDYSENDAATQIDAAATLTDADGDADWNGGTLVVQITADSETADQLSIVDNAVGTINTSGTNLQNGSTVIGTLSAAEGTVTNGTALIITFNASATNALVQQVVRAIHYSNTSDDPGTANRTITFTAADKNGASASDTRIIAVTAVNDEPTLTATGSNPTFIQAGAPASLFSASAANTVESGQALEQLIVTVTNVTDGSGADEIISIDGDDAALANSTSGTTTANSIAYSVVLAGGTATVTLTKAGMTPAAIQTLIDNLTYSNLSSAPSSANRVVTITSLKDNGGTANSGDDTNGTLSIASTVTVEPDLDLDGVPDSTDDDIDGDGMLNTYEDTNGLNKRDASDRDTDLDGDGVSNYDESVALTAANADDYPPILTVPTDVTVNATGLSTTVDIGTATAVDDLDGSVTPIVTDLNGSVVTETPANFQPGINILTWSATDAAGNKSTATQAINVNPQVSFIDVYRAQEGNAITFKAILNGDAVSYPITVPYTISNTSTAALTDHDLIDGSITITSGASEGGVSINLVDDGAGESDETIVVTMGVPTNAVKGFADTSTITITEEYLVPKVTISVLQDGVDPEKVNVSGGLITLTATVENPPKDPFIFEWYTGWVQPPVDTDLEPSTYTIDPSNQDVDPTFPLYASISLMDPYDGGIGVRDEIIKVAVDTPVTVQNTVVLTNTLKFSQSSDKYTIETASHLTLDQGICGKKLKVAGATLTTEELLQCTSTSATAAKGIAADDSYTFPSDLYDFKLGDLSVAGQSVSVVLPQFAQIPAGAIYRKYNNGIWQDFVEDTNNRVASAPGVEGYCPSPGDPAYVNGLNEGDWCVQLTLEDGGPNDADGSVNYSIDDPGGVAVVSTASTVGFSGSGSGSLTPAWLMFLSFLTLLGFRSKPRD